MNNVIANPGPMPAQTVSAPIFALPGHAEAAGNMGQAVEGVFLGTLNNAPLWSSGNSTISDPSDAEQEEFNDLVIRVSGAPRVKPGEGFVPAAVTYSAGRGPASNGSAEKRPRRTAEGVPAGGGQKAGVDRRGELDSAQRRLRVPSAPL